MSSPLSAWRRGGQGVRHPRHGRCWPPVCHATGAWTERCVTPPSPGGGPEARRRPPPPRAGPPGGAGAPGPAPAAARLAHPAATLNQLQAISAVTNTPLFESFTVLTPRFTPASAAGSMALATLDFAARYSPWQRGQPRTAHHAVSFTGPATPATMPGTTFVWDPATAGYIASSDSGAPANGERFVLYAISQRTGLPSVPLAPIGYVDLTAPPPPPDSNAAGVTLVGTPAAGPVTTYASYRV